MKNKVKFKEAILKIVIISISMSLIFAFINLYEYRTYVKSYNNKIMSIVTSIKEKYPDISDNEIMDMLNSDSSGNDMFRKYGIDIRKEAIIEQNDKSFIIFIISEIIIIIFLNLILMYIFVQYNMDKSKDIIEITELIDKINHRNYELKIDETTEDELSILKNEIYKTTIMLREETDNSLKDKLILKKSIEDISHQIKTPLTSIVINLDNLLDNPDLNSKRKELFLREIKNKTYSISFLIESLLKLSKFDVNTIKFNKKEVLVKELIDSSLDNVRALADLKNIKITTIGNNTDKMTCDFKWEIEAITNILKNAIEHSKENLNVTVEYETNKVYTKIAIKNFGSKISQKDLIHIFDRFYKGENSSDDSVGIGLALAKAIIEKDNGRIKVKSDESQTMFIIKYFK